jgi:hypothetical protein
MLFADDQIMVAKTEDELQTAANTLNKIARKCNLKISITKTKAMAICGKNIQRPKIDIDDTIIEQVTEFLYLGIIISEFKTNITTKIEECNKINWTIKIFVYFGTNMLPNTKLRLYNMTSKAALK